MFVQVEILRGLLEPAMILSTMNSSACLTCLFSSYVGSG